jgi:hypothetical protein
MDATTSAAKPPGKRLVVCLDGTWNTPDEKGNPTNVVKILRAVDTRGADGVPQVSFYDKGVGTGGPLDKLLGGVSGYGLDQNVLDGYRFLANNYEGGDESRAPDEIYLFGFSRGAYTARSLAGLVGRFGLLAPGNLDVLNQLWALYRAKGTREQAAGDLKKAMDEGYPEVSITCIGVWDTVGALGIPIHSFKPFRKASDKEFGFHDTELGARVRCAFHAVAIDEQRGPFEPTLWSIPAGAQPRAGQVVEQVWFPGVHSNVGGSYEDAGLSDLALQWMIDRVRKHTRLRFIASYLEEKVHPNAMGTLYDSRTTAYLAYQALPYARLIAQRDPGGLGLQSRLHLILHPPAGASFLNESLHVSALTRFGQEAPYKSPGNRTRYEPGTLRAALPAVSAGTLPVVNDAGEPLPAGEARALAEQALQRSPHKPAPKPKPPEIDHGG